MLVGFVVLGTKGVRQRGGQRWVGSFSTCSIGEWAVWQFFMSGRSGKARHSTIWRVNRWANDITERLMRRDGIGKHFFLSYLAGHTLKGRLTVAQHDLSRCLSRASRCPPAIDDLAGDDVPDLAVANIRSDNVSVAEPVTPHARRHPCVRAGLPT